jgi:hypothetical protein
MSECTCGCMCYEPKCTCLVLDRWFVPCQMCLDKLRIKAYHLSYQQWYSMHSPYQLLVEAFKQTYKQHASKELVADSGLSERYLLFAANEAYSIQKDTLIGCLDKGTCVVIDREDGVFKEPKMECFMGI